MGEPCRTWFVSSSPNSSSSSSSPSTASTTTSACSRKIVLEIATAIAEGKMEIASEILALPSWINPAENSSPAMELYGKEHIISTQLLYELAPCFKLGFMAANLAIFDAGVLGREKGKGKNEIEMNQ